MSSTVADLLRAICHCPEDNVVRLAYADLLDEHDDPIRAEFIRIQVELSQIPESDPRRPQLEDREHALLTDHEAQWLGELIELPCDTSVPDRTLNEWEWDRGFLSEVAATPLVLQDHGPELFAAHPVTRWRVMSSQADLEHDLINAGQIPGIQHLTAIDLAGWYQSVGEMERFLTRSEFHRLAELDVAGRVGLADLPQILARAPFRDHLRVLRCGGSYPGDCGRLDLEELRQALGSAQLTELAAPGTQIHAADLRGYLHTEASVALRDLDLRDNEVEPDGWTAFRNTPCRPHVLDLSGTPLGAIGLESLLGCEALSGLHSLDLNRCGSAMANIRAVAGSVFWRQARELRMHSGTVTQRTLEPLFHSRHGPTALRSLDLSGNFVRDSGVSELAAAEWAKSLLWLALSRNYLTDDAARIIATSGCFARLRTLHLSYNRPQWQDDAESEEAITDSGAKALANSAVLKNLRLLSLSGTQLTAAGVDAVLNSPHWRLAGLGLAACDLTADSVALLANSPRLARLTWLDLSQNPRLRGSELLPLAESPFLGRLMELDLRGVPLNDRVRTLFQQRLGRRFSE